jgi:hypothetical protein
MSEPSALGTADPAATPPVSDPPAPAPAAVPDAPAPAPAPDAPPPVEAADPAATPTAEVVYEFTLPEGVTLPEADRTAFTTFCKELELSPETAQKLLDKQLTTRKEAQAEAAAELDTVQTTWRTQQAADKEFGGAQLQANIALGIKAVSHFGSPELVQLLNDSRIGDHPEMLRFCYRIGKALAEDKFTPPAGEVTGPKTQAERLYPKLASNR